jgi:hypothetical protein
MNTKRYFINYSINNSKNDLNSFYEIDKDNITPIKLKEITISDVLIGGSSEITSSNVDTITSTSTELTDNTSTDNTSTDNTSTDNTSTDNTSTDNTSTDNTSKSTSILINN